MFSDILRTSIFVLLTPILPIAHNNSEMSPPPKLVLSLAKSVYRVGEEIEATVTLENAGTNGLYVPKYLGGGFSDLGFNVFIVRGGVPYCIVEANWSCGKAKRRSVDQILRDDFLLLPPGGLIGLHVRLRTNCVPIPPLPPGIYEVAARYSGSGMCLPDLGNKHTQFPVLRSKVETVRTPFELAEK